MKIWVVGRGYPTPANKMWGSFELEQAKLLARNGNDVSYIALTLSFLDRKDPRGMRSFEEDGVKVYAYSHFYFPGKLGVNWESFEDRCWRKLYQEAEKASGLPDVIHIHYPSMLSGVNVINEFKKQGIKIIVTEHWSRVMINTLKKHEIDRLQYYAHNADRFVCVSELLQNAVKKQTEVTVPMDIIPNIVSPMFFDQKPVVKSEKRKDEFVFICVGRLVPLKQFDIIIEQFIKNFSDKKNVILKIVGSGSERMNLYNATDGKSRIWFTGELSLKDVAFAINSADALVSFSKYETFAAPVAEAWACGKPVILSNNSGIASYAQEEYGVVVPSDDPDQLGKAMLSMYENYDRYDSKTISLFAKKQFSDDAIFSKLQQVYTE